MKPSETICAFEGGLCTLERQHDGPCNVDAEGAMPRWVTGPHETLKVETELERRAAIAYIERFAETLDLNREVDLLREVADRLAQGLHTIGPRRE